MGAATVALRVGRQARRALAAAGALLEGAVPLSVPSLAAHAAGMASESGSESSHFAGK